MEEWKEYKLGDIAQVKGGKRLPKGVNLIKAKNSHPYIRVRDLGQKKVLELDSSFEYVDDETQKSISRYIVNSGDIIVSIVGTIGLVAIIGNSLDKSNLTENCVKLIDITAINKEYLYYYLVSELGKNEIEKGIVGAVQAKLPIKNIQAINIKAPNLESQRRIASILKSLDDKIEANSRINDNLEQQAQALFKSWFVDFEPFKDGEFVDCELGRIPKGWRVRAIGDYCKVRSGYAFKSSWWSNSGIPVVKIKNITDDGRLDMTDSSFVSNEHADLAKEFQTKVGDLLIAMTGATIGKFCIVHSNNKLCVNQRVGKFFLGDNPLKRLPFVYYYLKRPNVFEEIVRRGQGSAQPNISGKDIETISIIYPSEEIIAQFNLLLYPFLEKVICNHQESRRLATLRDTLLPKLMSGELKVNEIEI